MFTAIVFALALLGQSPTIPRPVDASVVDRVVHGPASKADRWHDLQYLGRIERGGFVLVATHARVVAGVGSPAPLNYGVDLIHHPDVPGEIRGSDPALRKIINEALEKEKAAERAKGAQQIGTGAKCGTIHGGPCPGPNCPKPDKPILPFPDPFQPVETPLQHYLPLIVAVVVAGVFGFFLLVLGLVAAVVLRRKTP